MEYLNLYNNTKPSGPAWTIIFSTNLPISNKTSFDMSILQTKSGFNVNLSKKVNNVRSSSISLKKLDLDWFIETLEMPNLSGRSLQNKYQQVSNETV